MILCLQRLLYFHVPGTWYHIIAVRMPHGQMSESHMDKCRRFTSSAIIGDLRYRVLRTATRTVLCKIHVFCICVKQAAIIELRVLTALYRLYTCIYHTRCNMSALNIFMQRRTQSTTTVVVCHEPRSTRSYIGRVYRLGKPFTG